MNENTTQNDRIHEDDLPEDAAAAGDAAERAAELEGQIAELKSQLLYANAETQNVRRRLEKEKSDAVAYAATAFARDMLSVADNLTRALASIPADARGNEAIASVVTGVEMTAKELENIFQRQGVAKVEAMGQKLDPNRHQAMLELENGDAEPGTIIQELQSGYMLRDRLLRPALVAVAKAPAGPSVGGRVDAQA